MRWTLERNSRISIIFHSADSFISLCLKHAVEVFMYSITANVVCLLVEFFDFSYSVYGLLDRNK